MTVSVRVPSPEQDRPRLATIIGVAILSALLGLAIARWGMSSRQDGPSAERLEGTPAAAGTTEQDVSLVEPSREPTAPARRTAAAASDSAPTSPASPAAEAGLRVVRGRVAYLRCEGLAQRSGPAPCPRDERLEAQAWQAIEGLIACPDLPVARGEADLTVDLAPGRSAEIRARDTFAAGVVRLDAARVVECLSGALSQVQQDLGASRLIVSFRFAVR